MLPFEKIDSALFQACGKENDFEAAIGLVVEALDPENTYRLLSAARIVFGRTPTRHSKTWDRPVEGSVIEAWPYLAADERSARISEWLSVMQENLSK